MPLTKDCCISQDLGRHVFCCIVDGDHGDVIRPGGSVCACAVREARPGQRQGDGRWKDMD